MKKSIIDDIQLINIPDTVELVLSQIKDLIAERKLLPGDRLPSEQKIADRMGLSRIPIRKAFARMEIYGLLNTVPQSGSYITNISTEALIGLFNIAISSDITGFDSYDVMFQNEIRDLLEIHAVGQLASNATKEQIEQLEDIHNKIVTKFETQGFDYLIDATFHLKIIELNNNPILKSFYVLIYTSYLQRLRELSSVLDKKDLEQRHKAALKEHHIVINAIKKRDKTLAEESLRIHFNNGHIFHEKFIEMKKLITEKKN